MKNICEENKTEIIIIKQLERGEGGREKGRRAKEGVITQ